MILHLLGAPRLEFDEVLPFNRPALLLYYLAYREDWVSRHEVTFLFWPDEDDYSARRNLRQLLHRARSLPMAAHLDIEPQRLRLRLDTDVRRFREAIGQGQWDLAAALYRGPLLDGIPPLDLDGYSAWLATAREALHRSWREAVLQHAETLGSQDRWRDAAFLLNRLWQSNILDEHALRSYMRCAYEGGSRDEALAAYRTFSHHLESELGLGPMPETAYLGQAIAAGKPLGGPPPKPRVQLPQFGTPFVAREADVITVTALLHSGRRFILLTGPGGAGKTRLAVQVAAEEAERYHHGVLFVPLRSLSSAEEVLLALAHALSLTLTASQPPAAQLAAYLRNKHLLLIIDQLEVAPEAAALLTDLLSDAPDVTVLATSRMHLPLATVSQHEVGGLGHAEGDASEAATFFLMAARRSNPTYRLPQDERPDLAKLCRLVGGLPLALELAAAWVGRLSLSDVCSDLLQNFDRLSGTPQAGMRASFETSWTLLSPEEQRVLGGLSSFRGGFGREGAVVVAGATLFTLQGLVGKSLVHRAAAGRYDLHELIRQYAAEKLAATPFATESAARHAAYVARLLAEQQAALRGPKQLDALATVALEIDNVRSAWPVLLRDAAWEALVPATAVLGTFLSVKGWAQEGARLFMDLAERARPGFAASEGQQRVYGLALERQGWFSRQLGQTDAARIALDEAVEVLVADAEGRALCHVSLGTLYASLGDFGRAKAQFIDAVAGSADLHPTLRANALNGLGNVCRALGELVEARAHYESALALAEASGNAQIAATLLCNLGTALYYLEDRNDAEAATRRSLALAERVGDTPLTAVCLANLAEMVFVKGDHAEAHEIRRQSLALRQDLGDREGEAFDTLMLGYDACRQGDAEAARQWFLAGLTLAHAISALPLVLDALVGLAEVALHQNELGVAARYLSVVLAHPATPAEVKDRARNVAARCPDAPAAPHLDDLLGALLTTS